MANRADHARGQVDFCWKWNASSKSPSDFSDLGFFASWRAKLPGIVPVMGLFAAKLADIFPGIGNPNPVLSVRSRFVPQLRNYAGHGPRLKKSGVRNPNTNDARTPCSLCLCVPNIRGSFPFMRLLRLFAANPSGAVIPPSFCELHRADRIGLRSSASWPVARGRPSRDLRFQISNLRFRPTGSGCAAGHPPARGCSARQ